MKKKSMKKYQPGGFTDEKLGYRWDMGPVPQTKFGKNTNLRSKTSDGKYVTRIKTDSEGNLEKLKSRRTVKGFLTGAPRVKDNLKRGGMVKAKKK